jgi:hypothetical protein
MPSGLASIARHTPWIKITCGLPRASRGWQRRQARKPACYAARGSAKNWICFVPGRREGQEGRQ